MKVARWRWVVAYWLFRLVIFFGRLLPTRLCYAVAAPIADVCYVAFREKRRHLVDNLTRVLGDEALARSTGRLVFRQFGRYVIDFFQVPTLGAEAIRRRTAFDDWERLDSLRAGGHGAIVATLHLGQWEMGAAALSAFGYPISVIAQTFEYAPMDRLVQSLRSDLGMKVIPAERAAAGVVRALQRNELVGMLVDVVPDGQGVPVRFFGAEALMSDAPARIALRTGARLTPALMARHSDDPTKLVPVLDFDFAFQPTGDEAADVRSLTQALATALEPMVRRHIDQWYVFHPVWRSAAAVALPRPERSEARERPKGEKWKEWTLSATYRLVGWLPRGPAYGIAWLVGDLAYRIRAGARADVEDNMRHVMGPGARRRAIRRAAKEAFRNVCRYYADMILIPRTDPKVFLREHVNVAGLEGLKAALAEGRGAVVATAHFGNPEMGVQVAALLGLDVLVLSEPLRPPAFDELVHRLRETWGARYEEVGVRSIRHAFRHLKAGGCLAIAVDRDIQGTGAILPFFGSPTRMPIGAAEIALRTGAALVPASCRRRKNGYDLVFEEPMTLVHSGDREADVVYNARRIIERIEPHIRSDPGQWFVLERVWDACPAGK